MKLVRSFLLFFLCTLMVSQQAFSGFVDDDELGIKKPGNESVLGFDIDDGKKGKPGEDDGYIRELVIFEFKRKRGMHSDSSALKKDFQKMKELKNYFIHASKRDRTIHMVYLFNTLTEDDANHKVEEFIKKSGEDYFSYEIIVKGTFSKQTLYEKFLELRNPKQEKVTPDFF